MATALDVAMAQGKSATHEAPYFAFKGGTPSSLVTPSNH
jgi:hypothetical protein